MRKIDPALHEKLKTLINSMGCDLIGVELASMGRQTALRIYIDKTGGVSVDDCSKVSHQVSAMLDVADPIQDRYHLEVSSPGIDRPLFEIEHYQKHIGSQVKIRLYTPINQRRQYKGVLVRVEDSDIYLLTDDTAQEVKLPFSAIEKANLIGEVHF